MSPRRVLLFDTKHIVPPDLPAALERESEGELIAHVIRTLEPALEELSRTNFDAVICWAEHRDDLMNVVRIMKGRASLPVVVISARPGPAFQALAAQMGVTRVVPAFPGLPAVLKGLDSALRSGDLARELKARSAENFIRIQERQLQVQETRRLARVVQARLSSKPVLGFSPLMVEDDLDEGSLMTLAFKKAGVAAPLQILRSGEEAITYFTALVRPGPVDLFLPTLVMLDLELPRKSGLDVLEWMKSQKGVAHIPVVISGSTNPHQVNRAYLLGAHYYLHKPSSFDGRVALATKLAKERIVRPGRS